MIAGLAKVRASVNQLVRALNVSRDEISYTKRAPKNYRIDVIKPVSVGDTVKISMISNDV